MTSLQKTDQWFLEMRRGDWEAAWRISDRIREERGGREPRDAATGLWLPRHLQWVWDGSTFEGKRVLVRCYHGLGDTIQFARFIPLLKHSVAHLSLLGQAQLLPLLETVKGIDALLPLDEGRCEVQRDLDIEIMELPYALRTTLASLPTAVPYIHVARKSRPCERLPRPRVGLVWQSGSWDSRRSVEPELMEKLTQLNAIEFRVLQRGPAVDAWHGVAAAVPPMADILDEAAELLSLDLLICVDTLSAHLAGALGVATWLLLPLHADWRWMEDREDTPWYPTMRLFRQRRLGDWESVIARVAHELRRRFPCARHQDTP